MYYRSSQIMLALLLVSPAIVQGDGGGNAGGGIIYRLADGTTVSVRPADGDPDFLAEGTGGGGVILGHGMTLTFHPADDDPDILSSGGGGGGGIIPRLADGTTVSVRPADGDPDFLAEGTGGGGVILGHGMTLTFHPADDDPDILSSGGGNAGGGIIYGSHRPGDGDPDFLGGGGPGGVTPRDEPDGAPDGILAAKGRQGAWVRMSAETDVVLECGVDADSGEGFCRLGDVECSVWWTAQCYEAECEDGSTWSGCFDD